MAKILFHAPWGLAAHAKVWYREKKSARGNGQGNCFAVEGYQAVLFSYKTELILPKLLLVCNQYCVISYEMRPKIKQFLFPLLRPMLKIWPYPKYIFFRSLKVKWYFCLHLYVRGLFIIIFFLFLAHLSTKCSWWAIVISLCPSSVRCQLFASNDFSSKTARRILK